ncbi:MAG: NADH-quinone oxidoreductase subunit N [Cyanobacteria bacterium HKST-UBA06]|nr:NADH-quinone oxidoreductase subunit N [Cyanobacteria bacterium HKST-UBA06]
MTDGLVLDTQFLKFLLPELCLTIGVLMVMVLTIAKTRHNADEHGALAVVSMLFSLGALALLGYNFKQFVDTNPSLIVHLSQPFLGGTLANVPEPETFLYATIRGDFLSYLIRGLLLLGLVVIIPFSTKYLEKRTAIMGDYYLLVMGATLGGMVLALANDLILLFVGLETLSITSYILAGYLRRQRASAEASFKYLVYGGVATAFFLFGTSLIYGLTGSTNLQEVTQGLLDYSAMTHPTLVLMVLMVMATVLFKLSIAPFQMWTPDVYEGAPTPVAAFLSVVSKTAAFALLIRMFSYAFLGFADIWQPVMMLLAVVSMIVGNVVALKQTSLKRLLAYSTIAHAGYMLLGIVVLSVDGLSSTLYYLLAYLFMNLGAFAAVLYVENAIGSDQLSDISGLLGKRPGLVLGLSVCLLSLAGIPITAGFFAKFFLFRAVIAAGNEHMWLILFALLTSTISLYYYLNPMRLMIVGEPSKVVEGLAPSSDTPMPLTLATVATIVLGVWASIFLNATDLTARQLLASSPPIKVEPPAVSQHLLIPAPSHQDQAALHGHQ